MNSAGEMGFAKAAALHFAFLRNNIRCPCEINATSLMDKDMIHETFDVDGGYDMAPKGPYCIKESLL
jgi:hypothetical protein